jgi:putative transposase
MVSKEEKSLSFRKQCELLNISRSPFYNEEKAREDRNRDNIVRALKKLNTDFPCYGARKLKVMLHRYTGIKISRYMTGKYMEELGIKAIGHKRKLTKPNRRHKKYPYLLKELAIIRANQVWATDITYLRINGWYVYLMAIIDLFSRKILSWGISNTQDVGFCLEVLSRAMKKHGKPEIFNTDQGSQYTSKAFTALLEANDIKISMDGAGRALDNVYIERFWRTYKYEDFYLRDYSSMKECRLGIKRFIKHYNRKRIHQSLEYRTPDEIYKKSIQKEKVREIPVIPHYSWFVGYPSMKEYTFEECVDIFRKGESVDEQLRAA